MLSFFHIKVQRFRESLLLVVPFYLFINSQIVLKFEQGT